MIIKLKECPFCGRIPELKDLGIGTGGQVVSCSCGVIMTSIATKNFKEPDIHKELGENVIKQWNTRHNLVIDKLSSCKHVYKVALYNNSEVCVNCGHIRPLA